METVTVVPYFTIRSIDVDWGNLTVVMQKILIPEALSSLLQSPTPPEVRAEPCSGLSVSLSH